MRAVACTGPAAAQNLALIGAWDGSVHLLDLDDAKPTRPMAGETVILDGQILTTDRDFDILTPTFLDRIWIDPATT